MEYRKVRQSPVMLDLNWRHQYELMTLKICGWSQARTRKYNVSLKHLVVPEARRNSTNWCQEDTSLKELPTAKFGRIKSNKNNDSNITLLKNNP